MDNLHLLLMQLTRNDEESIVEIRRSRNINGRRLNDIVIREDYDNVFRMVQRQSLPASLPSFYSQLINYVDKAVVTMGKT